MNRRLLLLALLLPLAACATVFTGTRDDITVRTEPPGAVVIIDGIEYGRTPVTFSFKREALRQSGKTVTLKKEGYQERQFQLQKDFNVIALCNAFNGLFWAIDFVTGAIFLYDPTSYSFTLEPDATEAGLEAPFYLARRDEGCKPGAL